MPETTDAANKPGRSPITLFVIAVVCAMLVMALIDMAALLTITADGEACAGRCSFDPVERSDRLVLWARLSGVAALVSMFLTAGLPPRIRWYVGLSVLGAGFVLQAVALTS
ncbi:hypothetical protein [Embleya sp. NPDC001921]